MSFLRPAHILSALLLALTLFGCRGNGVGDPCVPEVIPSGGFDPNESNVETSSVQCRTRTCVVFQLDGNPERISGTPSCTTDCVSEQQVADHVFCSCRCSTGGEDINAPLCNCPNNFVCDEDLVQVGGQGLRGGYCIRCQCPGDDSGLNPDIFPECDNCNS